MDKLRILKTRMQARARRDRFMRRKRSFIKKAHELHAISGAQVYVVIRYADKYHTYTSIPDRCRTWPPSQQDIVSQLPHLKAGR